MDDKESVSFPSTRTWLDNTKVKLSAKLDVDSETAEKIKNFTKALNELPRELNINISINDVKSDNSLKVNLADLIMDHVKKYFNNN